MIYLRVFFIFIFFSIISSILHAEDNINNKIYKNLRCLVCQGQTIADSNSDFAQTIKLVVSDKLTEGMNENEIYEFLSEKYGDWILYKPPFKRNSYLLWSLPYAIFILGGLIIFVIFKKKGKI